MVTSHHWEQNPRHPSWGELRGQGESTLQSISVQKNGKKEAGGNGTTSIWKTQRILIFEIQRSLLYENHRQSKANGSLQYCDWASVAHLQPASDANLWLWTAISKITPSRSSFSRAHVPLNHLSLHHATYIARSDIQENYMIIIVNFSLSFQFSLYHWTTIYEMDAIITLTS